MINLEIKILVSNNLEIKKKILEIKARSMGILQQTDIYFILGDNRLKLRKEEGRSYFVYYKRPDIFNSKFSRYYICNIPMFFFEVAKRIGSLVFGVKVVVNKKREFFLYKNTRIHLDKVDKLGEFIELETVFTKGIDEEELKKEHFFIINFLGLDKCETIKKSYSDLIFSLSDKQK